MIAARPRRRALAALAAWAALAPAPLLAQEAQLGPGDRLTLRVLEWDGVDGEVRDWPQVSGEYLVGPDGAIDVPFAGPIEAAARPPDEVAAAVVEALRERLALVEAPDVTVEVASWRPVIVTGDVRAPGQVEFSPGLLAIQAVGLAGGAGTPIGDDAYRSREVASAQALLVVLEAEERRFLAREARLAAELSGAADLVPPGTGPEWDGLLAQERQLLGIRRSALAREVASLDEQAELYETEIGSLEQKIETLVRQRDLAGEASANTEALSERGLVANQRVFDADRLLADIEGQLLDVSTAILRARQRIAEVARERAGLEDARIAETVTATQEAAAGIEQVRGRIAGQVAVLEALGAQAAAGAAGDPLVSIRRPDGGGLRLIEAAALVPLLPGDIVEVTRPTLPLDRLLAAPPPVPAPPPDGAPGPAAPLAAVPVPDAPSAGAPSAADPLPTGPLPLASPPVAPAAAAQAAPVPSVAPVEPTAGAPAPDASAAPAADPGPAADDASTAAPSDEAAFSTLAQPMTEPPALRPPSRPVRG